MASIVLSAAKRYTNGESASPCPQRGYNAKREYQGRNSEQKLWLHTNVLVAVEVGDGESGSPVVTRKAVSRRWELKPASKEVNCKYLQEWKLGEPST